ncbi:MltR family transcriptional regulator [Vibrio jasicida]|uniref:MltR family transcriptional regulator n=1 Tax=Vibrio jasicida TaxID=766224 RepID=UPI0006ACB864|nr:MltR family transcriptional regulator [Vibrio jasicida]
MVSYDTTNKVLKGESDRGAVLIAAAMLELGLAKLLRAKMLPSTSTKDPVFDNNGPLGTFSSKIEMSYRLGVITRKQKDMFNIFRKIRNDFAHSADNISFTDPKIKDRLFSAIEGHKVKDAYFMQLQQLASEFGMNANSINNNSVSPRELFELIFGLEIEYLRIELKGVIRIEEKVG